ncbi:MAG: RHS repeat-associated core domain-containing protein [Oligoflexia bacterium]|nr:RHS repeat-associated core domain-containing protein [Oligoflexia bacterium]
MDPYGERKITDQTFSKINHYAQGSYDSDLGVVRLGHRFYDPAIGRFLTPDPLFLENPDRCVDSPVECNLYSYVGNNPISNVDPSGEFLLPLFAAAATAYSLYDWAKMDTVKGHEGDGISSTTSPIDWAIGAGVGKLMSGMGRATETAAESSIPKFELHPRVTSQLNDPRMGSLAGKLDESKINTLLNSPTARRLMDNESGYINVVQKVEDRLIRMTVPRDEFKVISVGPIKENGIINGIEKGRFTPMN